MDMVEELLNEREASNALDNVLGGAGATGELLKAGATGVVHGIHNAIQNVRDRINAPRARQQARQTAANAAQNYRQSLKKVTQHAANAPKKTAPAGTKLHYQLKKKALNKQAANAYTNYQNAKNQIK